MTGKEKFSIIIFMLLVYVLNSGHIAQQLVFSEYYVPLTESILNNFEYGINGKLMTYPMWGYSFFMILGRVFGSYENILVIQFILCFLSIICFYSIFEIKFKKIQFLFLLPYIALCSVKWNDALVASFIIFYIYYLLKAKDNNNFKYNLIAGLMLGVILNLRSEYLIIPVLQILVFIGLKSVRQSVNLKLHSVIYLTACLTLLPWAIRNYIEFDEFKFTSSNGASVMYISLGQLEDNVWNIEAKDNTAFRLARKRGVSDPYSIKGEEVMREEFLERIEEEPTEYLKKCLNNGIRFFTGGVYTGEYGSLLISEGQRQAIDNKINNAEGSKKIDVIIEQKFYSSYPILFEKIVLQIYRLIWLVLIMLFIYMIFKKEWNLLIGICLIFIIHKLIIVSGIQYEYRHLNSIYLIVLGLALKTKVLNKFTQSV